jgi:hypothetical protein
MIRFCAVLGDDGRQNDFMVFPELLQRVRDDLPGGASADSEGAKITSNKPLLRDNR